MSVQSIPERVVAKLDTDGVGYMPSGSLASSLQGDPRAICGIDIVVDTHPGDVAGE